MNHAYKIGIIEDDVLLAGLLKDLLEADTRVHAVYCAGELQSGLTLIKTQPLEFLIVDIGLPDGDGIEAIYAARSKLPNCKIVVYSVFDDDARLFRALQAGAHGYVQKQDTQQDFLSALLDAQAGATVSPAIAKRMLEFFSGMLEKPLPVEASTSVLSVREMEVLKHVSLGRSLVEIAQIMQISHHTVKTYLRRVYEKLEVNSKLQAIQKARDNLWI